MLWSKAAGAGGLVGGGGDPFDLSTATYSGNSYSISSPTAANSFFFSPDGANLFIADNTSTVYKKTLSTPWDLSTVSDAGSFSVSSREDVLEGIFFKPDGTRFYFLGNGEDTVYQYNMTTPWTFSGGSYPNSREFNVQGQTFSVRDLYFSSDGTKMYVNGTSVLYQYTLPTPWEVTSVSFVGSIAVSSTGGTIGAVIFNDDGSKLYTVSDGNNAVHQWSVSTPWSVTTAASEGISLPVGSQDSRPSDAFFKTDGSAIYVLGDSTNTIYQYDIL